MRDFKPIHFTDFSDHCRYMDGHIAGGYYKCSNQDVSGSWCNKKKCILWGALDKTIAKVVKKTANEQVVK